MGSAPLGKFPTLLDSSTTYKNADSHRSDRFCSVLNMELLQFYYSRTVTLLRLHRGSLGTRLMSPNPKVRLDRVQLVSWAPQGRKPPALEGYKVVRDCFVKRQTTIATYARNRHYQSLSDDTKIFWQYQRLKPWLRPWKVTIVADDETGLSYEQIQYVLKHCHYYRFLIVEIAVDFPQSAGIDKRFVRKHGVFGKSRCRAKQRKTTGPPLRRPQDW